MPQDVKMENKTQRNERLRKMRQKYHIGEYKHLRKSVKGGKPLMAKKRRTGKRYGKSSGITGGIIGSALGVGAYILFESMIEPRLLAMANIQNPLLINVGELMLGVYLSKKGGVMGNIGKACVIVNLYQILQPYLSGVGKSTTGGYF